MQELDNVQLNFDNSTLMIMNICLGFVMFGVALGLSLEDFKRLAKMPKLVLVGFLSQFFVLPLVTFLFVLIVKPIPNMKDLINKLKRKPTIDIDQSSFSIKEEIEHLIRKQDSLIAENIEVKKRLNILLNKI